MKDDHNLNIDLDNKKITDDIKKEMKESDTIHIHKTDDDGEEFDIDIDKNKKTVNVNFKKNKEGKKTNVKIGFSGIKGKDGEKSINIPFWPIYIFLGLVIGVLLFLIYKVIE